MFPREKYYSQTEIIKTYQISVKRFKELVQKHNIPVLSKNVNLGTYSVNTVYVLREDVEKLKLNKRN